ncbi:MAG TPA: hypothetical protein DCY13_01910 [Verrucomicrobiales bacterium]|nr:hypothetical protein [Verrucomicrobiales bacterium]
MKTNQSAFTLILLGLAATLPVFAQEAPPARTLPATSEARPAEAETADLRINFRNAPLEMVLDYLSEAAGFTIVLETQVKGTIDVWSNQPVTRQEAVDILDAALAKNGYAAIRNGKTLTIVTQEDARTRNIPIVSSDSWEKIPQTDVVATYIIPVRYISATDLITNLQPLLPEKMQISANQNSNSLIITDSQAAIRRIAHIASLLDSSVSGASSVRIIPLKHSDAKELAATINQLYATQNSSARGGSTPGRSGFPFNFGRGGNNDNNRGN